MIANLTPKFVQKISKILLPVATCLLIISFPIALVWALIYSPIDYQQGDMVRIMYIHVPAAWMSLGIYSFIALMSLSTIIWQTRISYLLAVASAPIGACFAFITLVTGSLWGKPIWGTWWVWDARLTSMLILFLQYITYIAIIDSSKNLTRAEKPASVMALVGFVNVPIVKFSVDIWYSLHQPSSVFRTQGVAIHPDMLKPLLLMFFCFILYYIIVTLMRFETILNQQKKINRL